jgi:hypothetical protein
VHCDSRLTEAEQHWYENECESCAESISYEGDDVGKKYDDGKPRYSLVPPDSMSQFVDVLTFGAKKYGDHNWKKIPDLQDRYYDALQRHVASFRAGDRLDDESGLHHLAHAMCCISFMMQDDVDGDHS